MKTKQILELVMIAALVGGCNWNSRAVLGGDPERPVGPILSQDYSYSCSVPVLRVDQQVAAQGCEMPSTEIVSVEPNSNGVIHIWVKPLADGKFPTIPLLVFDQYSNAEVPFDCVAGAPAPDGRTAEVICTPRTSKPVSGYNLRSSDDRLRIKSFVLRNPSCSSWVTYKRTYGVRYGAECSQRDSALLLGTVAVPDMWIDNSASSSAGSSQIGRPMQDPAAPLPPIPPTPPMPPIPPLPGWEVAGE